MNSLEINLNQKGLFLFFAGFSRVLVALLSGIVLLLAMRAKMIASSVYSSGPPEISAALTAVELFFTFLAGFSETFVPNILRDSEKSAGTAGINRTTEQIVAAEKAKAEAEQKAKAEAEQKAKAGAEQKAKAEAEQKDKAGAEQKAKAEAEQKAKAEAEQKAKAEAEQKDKAGK